MITLTIRKSHSEYKNEIGAENVIYTLLDTKNKLIYIGEAKKLSSRFDRDHPIFPIGTITNTICYLRLLRVAA